MSDAKMCDRCGDYYGPVDRRYNLIEYAQCSSLGRFPGKTFDICPSCAKRFEKWMNKHQQVVEVDDE